MRVCKRVFWIFAALILLSQCKSIQAQISSEKYVWRNVIIGGGGFVTGIIFHPRAKNLIYARTDVGGAYRWDASAQKWIPLTDWIGAADDNLTGIESIAVDSSDTNRVYLAAGIYSRGRAAILRSDNQGKTFQRTDVPFKMGGNEIGRFNGERLAVDPNDGKILFFGSRRDGLWKSEDYGVTWKNIKSFPTAGTPFLFSTNDFPQGSRRRFHFPPQQVGIVFVQFDSRSGSRGNPTPVIYAGVSTTQTNFFRSANAGISWQAVPGQPIGFCPNHAALSSNGIIYLSYGKEPGPNTMTGGAVWKFNTKTGVWTEITPVKSPDGNQSFGYGAIAVDAAHPETIMTTTFCHWKPPDEIFRSVNGGASWFPILAGAQLDHTFAPYTKSLQPHRMGSLQIDPFDSNHIMFATGYGIWSCNNLTGADFGKRTRWNFSDDGLEETVPLALISPPEGAHLLSGLGDIDGFRHDDLNASPALGAFAGPRFSNTEDLAFAEKNPAIIVRAGAGGNNPAHAAISFDGGKNWNLLGGDPPESFGGGNITVSADGKIIVWTPWRGAPNFSVNRGTNWTICAGLSRGVRVVADSVNPSRFYAFDSRAEKIFASTNGAESFAATKAAFPNAEEFGGAFGFGNNGFATLSAAPDNEGDLWLAFRANGLFHSANGGASFTKLENVREADSIGFGKAAAGKNFPALYLAGTIENLQGLFRSDDAGANWMRINDDQHQYGLITHVTGDPRIFGRVYLATSGRGIIYGDEIKE
ncbi:MAG: cellulase [Limisphaerales bacterium]